jgi:hypothetical protein
LFSIRVSEPGELAENLKEIDKPFELRNLPTPKYKSISLCHVTGLSLGVLDLKDCIADMPLQKMEYERYHVNFAN